MSTTTENSILLNLTGRSALSEVPIDQLTGLIDQYPSFGLAKYLLAKKAENEGHQGSVKYAQAAILHFNNPHWFHFKMNEEKLMEDHNLPLPIANVKIETPEAQVEEISFTDAKKILTAEAAVKAVTLVDSAKEETDTVPRVPVHQVQEEIIIDEEGQTAFDNSVVIDEPAIYMAPEGETKIDEDELIAVSGQDVVQDVIIDEEQLPDLKISEVTDEPAGGEEPITETRAKKEEIITVAEPVDSHEVIAINDPVVALTEPPAEPAYKVPVTSLEGIGQGVDGSEGAEGIEDADAENEAVMPAMGNNKISSLLQEQLEEFKKPVDDNTPVPIETEPYHTVDYFASQGIKLSAELQKQDHLSVKVKKFTDWLKQMKRINPSPVDLGIDEVTEHKVQDSAAISNELKEVVTEAMAEVLAMQGMTDKAIQVYIKLSFLDPAKY